MDYEKLAQQMKAIAEPNRMKIIDVLSCGPLCACEVLEHFDFSQPTLSHHMKVLENAGVVEVKIASKWHYYWLAPSFISDFQKSVAAIFASDDSCACQKKSASEKDSAENGASENCRSTTCAPDKSKAHVNTNTQV